MKPTLVTALLLTALSLALDSAASASTWYVNGVSGSDSNNCTSATTPCQSIGHVISLAASGDTIMIAPSTYTENLTIGISLNLIGSGAGSTIIDGGGVNTVITISNMSAAVTLTKLSVRHGNATGGAGIYNTGLLTLNQCRVSVNSAQWGGGIYNGGRLTINKSTVSGNGAFVRTNYSYGGGIYNSGVLTINSSTVSGNTAGCGTIPCSGHGGGIYNIGEVFLNNSTISGNTAYAHFAYSEGGGIATSGILEITNSTLNGNGANYGGAIYGPGDISNSTLSGNGALMGGDIYGNATLRNSIVANGSGGNCHGTITSNGYNLSSDSTCNFNKSGDLNNTDPQLGPLQSNGGPTKTMALPSGSPAIDTGNPNGCTDHLGNLLKKDQRGKPRPDTEDTGGCDMGAYERQSD